MFWVGGTSNSSPSAAFCDYSNSPSSLSGSIASTTLYSPDSSNYSLSDKNETGPYLEIVEQTASQFRFRYKSEMQGTHGAIQGINSSKRNKTFPSVRLCNYHGPAVIRCTLYTADKKSLHVHRLVGKSAGKEKEDPHDICIGPNSPNGYIANFQNLVIIHVAKKHLVKELVEKKQRVIRANYSNSSEYIFTPEQLLLMEKEAEEETKKMDMNCAVLKFEALYFDTSHYVPIQGCSPAFSNSIKNLKCHVHGQLKICRMDKVSGSCEGDEEVFLLVEKVGKDNIKVIMTEYDEYGEVVWTDYCKFNASDVHHQFAIVCRTPKYRFMDMKEKVTVDVQLERISDGARSEPREFTYLPLDYSCYLPTENNKRKRILNVNVRATATTAPVDRFPSPHQQLVVSSTTSEIPPHMETAYYDISNNVYPFADNSTWPPDHQLPCDIENNKTGCNVMPETAILDDDNMSIERSTSLTKLLNTLPTPDISQVNDFFSSGEMRKVLGNDYNSIEQNNCGSSNWLMFDGDCKTKFILLDDEIPKNLLHTESDFDSINNIKTLSDFTVRMLEKLKRSFAIEDGCCLPLNKIVDCESSYVDRLLLTRTCHGSSAFHIAVIYKQNKELESLIEFLKHYNRTSYINCYNASYQTPLHLAASGGDDDIDVAITSLLLDAGADSSITDLFGRTALHIAVKCGFIRMVKLLLDSPSVDINSISDNDGTALSIAAEKNEVEIAELLLKFGANLHSANKKTGRTPLHVAVINKHIDIISLFLENEDSLLNRKDFYGYTALQLSMWDENQTWEKINRVLVQHGAVVHTNDDNKKESMACKEIDDDIHLVLTKFFEFAISSAN